jgi:hypothetical protein
LVCVSLFSRRDKLKEELKEKILGMKEAHLRHIGRAKANQAKLEEEELRITNSFNMSDNLVELVPQLKAEFRAI